MFDAFGPLARRALYTARQEALNLGHAEVSTGHLLLGICSSQDPGARNALDSTGVSLEAARAEFDRLNPALKKGREPAVERHLGQAFTPDAKQAIVDGYAEALLLRGPEEVHVHAADLLMGVTAAQRNHAQLIIAGLGIDVIWLREQLATEYLREKDTGLVEMSDARHIWVKRVASTTPGVRRTIDDAGRIAATRVRSIVTLDDLAGALTLSDNTASKALRQLGLQPKTPLDDIDFNVEPVMELSPETAEALRAWRAQDLGPLDTHQLLLGAFDVAVNNELYPWIPTSAERRQLIADAATIASARGASETELRDLVGAIASSGTIASRALDRLGLVSEHHVADLVGEPAGTPLSEEATKILGRSVTTSVHDVLRRTIDTAIAAQLQPSTERGADRGATPDTSRS